MAVYYSDLKSRTDHSEPKKTKIIHTYFLDTFMMRMKYIKYNIKYNKTLENTEYKIVKTTF